MESEDWYEIGCAPSFSCPPNPIDELIFDCCFKTKLYCTWAVGQINLYSPDHISLLVHRTFNVSIPRHHIPTDHWEFEYGAAENDPEFGAGMGGEQSEDVLIGDRNLDEGEREEKEAEQGEGGRWVHSITGARLGGLDGFLEFTVIGCAGSFPLHPFPTDKGYLLIHLQIHYCERNALPPRVHPAGSFLPRPRTPDSDSNDEKRAVRSGVREFYDCC